LILYGRNPIREALLGRRRASVSDVWVTTRLSREPWLEGVTLKIAAPDEIERRCGSPAHQGICADAGSYPYAGSAELLARQEPLLVALDQVQDPQNLGSIARTAECVGADGLLITERRSAEVTPAVCKASAGAVEHLPVARVRNMADFLSDARTAGCWCYGASLPGEEDGGEGSAGPGPGRSPGRPVAYDTPDYRGGGVVLVLGSEGSGLRPRVAQACDQLISLPMLGRVGSLGVSAAASALLYEILQNRVRGA
jgi:23S rRNA (guanosine2251-2'-O)-methyltransferase